MVGNGGWHAHASSLELADLILLGVNQVCQFVQTSGALIGTEFAPWAFEGSTGGRDCSIDVCSISDRDILLAVQLYNKLELQSQLLLTATCLPVAGL